MTACITGERRSNRLSALGSRKTKICPVPFCRDEKVAELVPSGGGRIDLLAKVGLFLCFVFAALRACALVCVYVCAM